MHSKVKILLFSILFQLLIACSGSSAINEPPIANKTVENSSGTATYLGNEAVMIEHGDSKILFDPFFHNGFNIYQLVPDEIRDSLFAGTAPYDNIDAIFISHAHADHFSADDMVDFLLAHENTQLIAPQQAIDALLELEDFEDLSNIKPRLHAIKLAYKDAPVELTIGDLIIDAVRIPHAGWPAPARAAVANIVFRVTLNNEITVIHMGDADPNDEHFAPLIKHWNKQATNTAFPPYWFFLSEAGELILSDRINAHESIGIHVPIKVPVELIQSDADYFSKPSEKRSIGP